MSTNLMTLNENCKYRIKPSFIRDVKTEALLVFARTALERYFEKLDAKEDTSLMEVDENIEDIYKQLRWLKDELQKYVVNADYLLHLLEYSKKTPLYRALLYSERPLITYYDAMAKRMKYHFPSNATFMPEFVVICTLSNWILKEQKAVSLYPFLNEIDFIELTEKFEIYGKEFKGEKKGMVIQMHRKSLDIIEVLKKTKYRESTKRVSKQRKKNKG